MNALSIKNNQSFPVKDIPFLPPAEFHENVLEILGSGYRMTGLFPVRKTDASKIIAVFINASESIICIAGGTFENSKPEFESFANEFPHTNYFECELSENYGYVPLNHPWLRPVRKQTVILDNQPYNFYRLEGEEVHEVGVGPIHAGIIEPGHFRFQCHGELVYHLEINLGYQHRGVEDLILSANNSGRIALNESVTGDTAAAHANAHCSAMESLAGASVSLRAQVIRSIAEELERAAMHLSGLGGVANDIGFAIAASSYGRLRTLVINSLAQLCGSRFGKGLFVYGGTRFDFNDDIIKRIINNLSTVRNDAAAVNDYLFSSTGALSRFDGTGTVSLDFARKTGMVGPAARSCGAETDTRTQLPYGAYRYNPVSMITLTSGDVFARTRIRALETDESLRFIFEQLQNLPEGETKTEMGDLAASCGVVSVCEGWRGEVVHIALTGEEGNLVQYKIKDPSFNNWYGLGLALRKTPVSDFPLCNKSFDLSYAGHDL
jgi:Ni,Fe-hydrogenase III large subunit